MDYLAKINPEKSLLCHMIETGEVMKLLLTESIYHCDLSFFAKCFNMDEAQTLDLLCYIAAIHDIGKVHPDFQRMLHSGDVCTIRHEYESKVFLERRYGKSDVVRYFANIIALHHQKFRENSSSAMLVSTSRIYEDACILDDQLTKRYPHVFPVTIKNIDACGYMLTGFVIFADWLSSSGGMIRNFESLKDDVLLFFQNAHIAKCDVFKIHEYHDAWPYIQHMSNMQKTIKDVVGTHTELPVLTIIEDMPGSGKTEAGLFMAQALVETYGKSGLYIGLPTSATAGAMCDRYNDVLDLMDKGHARLMYGDAWLHTGNKQKFNSDAERWFEPLRLAMLQANGVGTVDQAIMGVLRKRFAMLCMVGLSSKVLIIDEVHAYDAYMQGELETLCDYCNRMDIPVILLSATLKDKTKLDLMSIYGKKCVSNLQILRDYPLLTMVFRKAHHVEQMPIEPSEKKSYRIHMVDDRRSGIRVLVDRVSQFGGCGFYIADTVRSAQAVYQTVKAMVSDDVRVLLFHARFSMARRQEIEAECIRMFGKDRSNRPEKAILIATQVIEQSLDISGDFLVTEPVGVDLFIQRIGRIWRHLYNEYSLSYGMPDIYVIEDMKLSKYVYQKDVEFVNNSLSWLKVHDVVCVPDDIRTAIAEADPDDMSEDKLMAEDDKFNGRGNTIPRPGVGNLVSVMTGFTDDDFSNTSARSGAASVGLCVLPVSLYDRIMNYDENAPLSLIRRVYEYKVNHAFADWMAEYQYSGSNSLNQMVLLRSDSEFGPCDTGQVQLPFGCVILDREAGLIIERA